MDEKTTNIDENNSNLFKILLAFLAVIVTLVVFYLTSKFKKSSRTSILLTGLCESGKTLIFTNLIYREAKLTYTSMTDNNDVYKFENGSRSIKLVDIPGYERLRGKFFDQYKNQAKGVVFVIDSVTLQKDIRDVADYLYTILSDRACASIPVLIVCNKQDETMAKGSSVIKSLLEKEINLVRQTRASQLQSVDNSVSNIVYLGKQGKDFEFSQLNQNIDFVECAAAKNKLTGVKTFLEGF